MLFPEGARKVLIPFLVSYVAGTLLGAAFPGMIPAGLKQTSAISITASVLTGIVLFFVLEKLVLWCHSHDKRCEVHGRAGPLILTGDAFRNFAGSVMISASFLSSLPHHFTSLCVCWPGLEQSPHSIMEDKL